MEKKKSIGYRWERRILFSPFCTNDMSAGYEWYDFLWGAAVCEALKSTQRCDRLWKNEKENLEGGNRCRLRITDGNI